MEKKKKRRIEKAWMKRRGKGGARKETREGIKLGCEAIKKLIGRLKGRIINAKCRGGRGRRNDERKKFRKTGERK